MFKLSLNCVKYACAFAFAGSLSVNTCSAQQVAGFEGKYLADEIVNSQQIGFFDVYNSFRFDSKSLVNSYMNDPEKYMEYYRATRIQGHTFSLFRSFGTISNGGQWNARAGITQFIQYSYYAMSLNRDELTRYKYKSMNVSFNDVTTNLNLGVERQQKLIPGSSRFNLLFKAGINGGFSVDSDVRVSGFGRYYERQNAQEIGKAEFTIDENGNAPAALFFGGHLALGPCIDFKHFSAYAAVDVSYNRVNRVSNYSVDVSNGGFSVGFFFKP